MGQRVGNWQYRTVGCVLPNIDQNRTVFIVILRDGDSSDKSKTIRELCDPSIVPYYHDDGLRPIGG
jgi:hypothetical protein